MPVQAALGAYFFLTAFEPHPSLVGSGRPFCLLVWSNLLQLGAYLIAAAFFVAAQFIFTDSQEGGQPLVITADRSVSVELPYPETLDATESQKSMASEATRESLM